MATDGGSASNVRTATASVQVNIHRNLYAPVFQNVASYTRTINYNAQAQVLAAQGTISATDADSAAWVSFTTVHGCALYMYVH